MLDFRVGTCTVRLVYACLPLLSHSCAKVITSINNVDIILYRNKIIGTILCPSGWYPYVVWLMDYMNIQWIPLVRHNFHQTSPIYKHLSHSTLVQQYAGWSACTPMNSVRNILPIAYVRVIFNLFYSKSVLILYLSISSCLNLDVQIRDIYKFNGV